jgi:hypothetical protein
VAVVNGYCSVADLRTQLDDEYQKIPDALIERAINAVSRAIDKYCGFPRRKFWKDVTPTTHVYTPEYSDALYMDDIADKTGLVVTIDGIVWPTDQFVLYPFNAELLNPAYAYTKILATGSRLFTRDRTGRPTVMITGYHGWSAVPDEVVEACIIRSTSILKRKDAPFGVAGFGEFGTSVRIRAEDPDVADLLGPFRRYGAGTVG